MNIQNLVIDENANMHHQGTDLTYINSINDSLALKLQFSPGLFF